jgi:acetate kinase
LALEMFVYRVQKYIGAFCAVLGKVDAIVFTAGIGENARALRARICDGLGFLGVILDPALNSANAPEISSVDAKLRVLVRRTDEERMIAEHTMAVALGG